ncbi:MAG: transcriptional regulator, MarR family [Solirubrobacterales bacterium]|jgi:DNA-binding MarR family transcriptional regulator|nr:transcriptional regulator, MarR family [Solirubrobacterales bacterium]
MATSVARTRARAQGMEAVAQSFKAANAAMRRLRGRDTHRPGALSHAQYQVLFELLRRGELPAGGLAAVADVSPASMTEMLDRLADAGLVERVRSETDRRVVGARLTPAGRAVCEERRAALEPLWREMLAGFTPAELATAAAVLDRLTELFERLGAAGEPKP